MKLRTVAIAVAILSCTLTVGGAAALASDEHRGERHRDGGEHEGEHEGRREEKHEGTHATRGAGAADPAYAKECGACHLAYPPSMLPAGAWRTMLGGLDRHFGQNAELDEATRARLEGWLAAQADRSRRAGDASPPQLRITQAAWFLREHREVPAGAAARPAVGSMANCGACHQDAARWDFDEHRVRIPR